MREAEVGVEGEEVFCERDINIVALELGQS